jgi:hypothetical protein
LLSTTELSVRRPADATSKMRNAGVPVAVERSMVAPFPVTVTFPVITGSAVPPSVVLLAAVSWMVQLLLSVTVPPPDALLAVVMAAIRLAELQVIAASAICVVTTIPLPAAMTAAISVPSRRTAWTSGAGRRMVSLSATP